VRVRGKVVGMDDDLEGLDREGLINEVKRLRTGIRAHRDSSGNDLCWHHPQLWALLPERIEPGGPRCLRTVDSCCDLLALGDPMN